MGLFGLLKYAHRHRLVRSEAISTPPGVLTPIAIDLWNVMYTLMEKHYQETTEDNATTTARCLLRLLRMLHKRTYFPIFVSDRGIFGNGRVAHGAKAIMAAAARADGDGAADAPPRPRWSTMLHAPRIVHRLCVNLIRHMGYAYVDVSDMEADDVCANLYHTNTVAQVHTTDTDMILTGCDMILDIAPMFPLVLRCRDVLASLGVDYSEFLAAFVRCHTDLHRAPDVDSVQQVAESLEGREVAPEDVKLKYASRCPDIMRDAGKALALLPAAGDARSRRAEREFIQHVVAMLTPARHGHLSVLRRVPIVQEPSDVNKVFGSLLRHVKNETRAKELAGLFWKHIPPPPNYQAVLMTYWDDCNAHRRK
ncbi:UL41 [Suid alphaherpesvirus 1]|jgi:hypothetical protein|uniref:Virion host shutoff protein n=1 Tax=Suid herpesvirus 1 TaxID=10345 RepID=A0A097I4I4_SUHV|nr:virion host shutoff protein [Suid alphaherpesvirus 1]AJD79509.1 mRNA-specific RNase [Suid alphaherpesvirus 1]AJW72259.1 UL41 [Suid alphaherpesvirus 1]AKG93992.1 vhs [Suid alphaherpesvirus 1]AKG94058.1 vhs [Suid alphaherpesvirus 1]